MYDFRSVVQSVAAGGNRIFFLSANPMRVSLIVSSTSSVTLTVGYFGGSGPAGLWTAVSAVSGITFPFSTCGPVMQQAVFVGNLAGGAVDVVVTEIFRIGDC